MAEVISLERFEVIAVPTNDDSYWVTVERLPLVAGGTRLEKSVPAAELRVWFRAHACPKCARAIDEGEALNPAHCGVTKAAIAELGFDAVTL